MRSTCDRLLVEPGKWQAYCVRRQDSLRATVQFSVGVLELMSFHLLSIVLQCGGQQLRHIFHCLTDYSTLHLALAAMLVLIWIIGGVLVLCRCFGRFCMIPAIQCTQWCLDLMLVAEALVVWLDCMSWRCSPSERGPVNLIGLFEQMCGLVEWPAWWGFRWDFEHFYIKHQ